MQNKSIEDSKRAAKEEVKSCCSKIRRSSMILESILLKMGKLKNALNSPGNGSSLLGASSTRDVLRSNKEVLELKGKEHKRKGNVSLTYLQHLLKSKTSVKQMDTQAIHIAKNKSIASSSTEPPLFVSSKKSHPKSLDIMFPLSVIEALKLFGSKLTIYEKSEILDYKQLYFMGNGVARRNAGPENKYDDGIGDYNTYVGEHIAYRYEIIDILGKGTFGQAIKCLDHKTRQIVALKIIKSKKKFYHQAMIEVKILKYLREHDKADTANIVKTFDFFVFRKHIVTPL
eukprot:TRINITY_DN11810_c0_g2_i1.p1 TRINITY_DN11810_c0_g2~~TRINITY_DN11810_c0_g2_i1.p1  ORF type:complete len:286 (+),score=58.54 TRINITY_DN11810_c0_g2_i1:478-1335(+)